MRVLLVAGTYPPGQCGIGDYVAKLAQGLAADGSIQVGVLSQEGSPPPPRPGVELLAGVDDWRLRNLPQALRSIRRWRPDLVHLHYPAQSYGRNLLPNLLPLACRLLGLRVVQTWHEPWGLLGAPRFLVQRMAAHALIFVRPNYLALLPRPLRALLAGCRQETIMSAGALPTSNLSAKVRAGVRARHLKGKDKLVVFFGFLYPAKGVARLFEIADPGVHALVIAGPTGDPAYMAQLKASASAHGWGEDVQYTGFLAANQAADLLAAADAVVLPFVAGGGDWNTSLHGALAQGTLVITTSAQPTGYDQARNLYTAGTSDIADMRRALLALAGRRVPPPPADDPWVGIARSHQAVYQQALQTHQAR